jgi:hypothetical protein
LIKEEAQRRRGKESLFGKNKTWGLSASDGFGFFVDPASHYHGAAGSQR